MNFRKLLTYLTMGTAAAMPIATAQNPTILQGSYVSNVFGPSNFVKNPNAQTNVADVTVSSATVTRSTTTPLVATSEFNITTSTSTGYADWSTRTFDAGMKNNNCEARFSFRGFTVGTTKAQLIQNSLVVAELTLVGDANNPKIASINFPCGDLTYATTFRLQQSSASLTGTNEIGGIYVGLATNQANVAQAEEVGSIYYAGTSACQWERTGVGSDTYGNFAADADCPTGTVTGAADTSAGKIPGVKFNNLKPGKYMFIANFAGMRVGTADNDVSFRMSDGTNFSSGNLIYHATTGSMYIPVTSIFTIEYTNITSPTIQIQGTTRTTTNTVRLFNGSTDTNFKLTAYRFPSASELVVKPETQNVFAGVKGTAGGYSNSVTSSAWTKLTSASTMTRTIYGKADSTATNDYSVTIKNMPVGTFFITTNGDYYATSSASGVSTDCWFALADSATGGAQIGMMQVSAIGDASNTSQSIFGASFNGLYTNTSVADRTFYVQAYRAAGAGSCNSYIDSSRPMSISVIPLDQPSNSALYVQGPVKAAETGAAISAGYVFEQTSSNPSFTITNNTATTQNITSFSLNPGVWMIEASCHFRSATPATSGWTFAAISLANANNSSAGTDQMSYTYSYLAHLTAGQYYNLMAKRYINVTTTTTYYLNTENVYTANNPVVDCTLKRTRLN